MPVEKKKTEEYRKSRVGARERLRLDFLPAPLPRVGMDGTDRPANTIVLA